jgi:signal transduction histidine kinase
MPFRQVESSSHRRFEGTGLGLPLAKKFIELHGGTLVIESAPSEGTTVTVVLPRVR